MKTRLLCSRIPHGQALYTQLGSRPLRPGRPNHPSRGLEGYSTDFGGLSRRFQWQAISYACVRPPVHGPSHLSSSDLFPTSSDQSSSDLHPHFPLLSTLHVGLS